MPTMWELFRSRWIKGCGSSLCPKAQNICMERGTVPCDILFVGEAPSIPADVVGKPFIGAIGNVMDEIIKKAGAERFSHAFTNVVCCVPRDPDDNSEETPPPEEAILACRPRLRGFITLCKPRLIMAVGRCAERALREMQSEDIGLTAPLASMIHPAAILHKRPFGGYEFRLAVDALAKALAEASKGGGLSKQNWID
jgi:uracil-DNA glycosylase